MSVLDPKIDHLDTTAKLIYLAEGVRSIHPIDDIYHEVRNQRANTEVLQQYLNPVSGGGAVPKGGGKFTPRYAVFHNGWRMVPEDVSHTLNVTGEQLTAEGGSGPACFDFTVLSPGTNLIVNYEPPAAEIIQLTNTLIEYSSFNGGVTVDVENGSSGTGFPKGTPQSPVDNLTDAHTIAVNRGFTTFYVAGDLDITSGVHEGHMFIGESPTKTKITLEDSASLIGVEFQDCEITGTLDGDSRCVGCLVKDLNYISGYIERCVLSGTITLGGATSAHFLDCWTGAPALPEATINLGGSNGPICVIRNLNGYLKLTNKSGGGLVTIDMASGTVELASTLTAGEVWIRGLGGIIDNAGSEFIVHRENLDPATVLLIERVLRNRTVTDPDTGVMTIYADDNVTPLLTANLYEDADGITPYSADSQRIDRRNRLQ